MAVYQRKWLQRQDILPGEAVTTSYTVSTTVASGPCEYVRIVLSDMTFGAEAHEDPLSFISRIAIVFDGTRQIDMIANYAETNSRPSPISMMIRDAGGRAYTVPGTDLDTNYEQYLDIPVGINLGQNSTVSRVELEINFFASGLAVSAGKFEIYGIYNDEFVTSVALPQSQTHISSANSNELINVKIPSAYTGMGYSVAGLVVQNDATGGMQLANWRMPLLGQFDVEVGMALQASGRAYPGASSGYWWDDVQAATAAQAQALSDGLDTGSLFLPTFGAVPISGSVELLLESTAANTYRITPILVRTGAAGSLQAEKQTASTKSSAEAEILRGATA